MSIFIQARMINFWTKVVCGKEDKLFCFLFCFPVTPINQFLIILGRCIVGTYVFTHIGFHAQYIMAGYFENVTLYYVIAFCLFTLTMTLSNCD